MAGSTSWNTKILPIKRESCSRSAASLDLRRPKRSLSCGTRSSPGAWIAFSPTCPPDPTARVHERLQVDLKLRVHGDLYESTLILVEAMETTMAEEGVRRPQGATERRRRISWSLRRRAS